MCLRYSDVFGTEEETNERLSLSFTPLYTQEEEEGRLKAIGGGALLLASLASAVVFYFLYCVYLNDKKFAFGIYSAFGASKHEFYTSPFFLQSSP